MKTAGAPERTDPRSKRCREFLRALRSICHRVALTPDIEEEWNKHNTRYSAEWWSSMESNRKIDVYPISADHDLRQRIQEAARNSEIARVMLKDARLIEAAIASDRRIASLDDTVRRHFAAASRSIPELRDILWVNPNKKAETAVKWLEDGAKDEDQRKLGFRPS
jgi:hypothetical protein